MMSEDAIFGQYKKLSKNPFGIFSQNVCEKHIFYRKTANLFPSGIVYKQILREIESLQTSDRNQLELRIKFWHVNFVNWDQRHK